MQSRVLVLLAVYNVRGQLIGTTKQQAQLRLLQEPVSPAGATGRRRMGPIIGSTFNFDEIENSIILFVVIV